MTNVIVSVFSASSKMLELVKIAINNLMILVLSIRLVKLQALRHTDTDTHTHTQYWYVVLFVSFRFVGSFCLFVCLAFCIVNVVTFCIRLKPYPSLDCRKTYRQIYKSTPWQHQTEFRIMILMKYTFFPPERKSLACASGQHKISTKKTVSTIFMNRYNLYISYIFAIR